MRIHTDTNNSDECHTHFRWLLGRLELGEKPVDRLDALAPSENSQTVETFPKISLRAHINFLTTVCGTFFEKSAFGATNPLMWYFVHLRSFLRGVLLYLFFL